MPSCVSCHNNNINTKSKAISFHRFPSEDKIRLQRWLIAVRSNLREPWTLEKIQDSIASKNPAFVCSEHFSADSCIDNPKARYVPYSVPAKVLLQDAFPTQFGRSTSRVSSERQREKRDRKELLQKLLQQSNDACDHQMTEPMSSVDETGMTEASDAGAASPSAPQTKFTSGIVTSQGLLDSGVSTSSLLSDSGSSTAQSMLDSGVSTSSLLSDSGSSTAQSMLDSGMSTSSLLSDSGSSTAQSMLDSGVSTPSLLSDSGSSTAQSMLDSGVSTSSLLSDSGSSTAQAEVAQGYGLKFHTYCKPPSAEPDKFVTASTQTELTSEMIESLMSSTLCSTPKAKANMRELSFATLSPVASPSDKNDPTFNLSSFETDMDDTDTDYEYDSEEEEEGNGSQFYIVHRSKLLERFQTCECGQPLAVWNMKSTGSMLAIEYECSSCSNRGTWHSQPKIGSMAAGNLLIPAAILFTGGTYKKFADICDTLRLQKFSESHYNNVQRTYLLPAVNDYYLNEQQLILRRFQATAEEEAQQVTLLGDGRCDSPGHCAKYCSYTLMEEKTQFILDFQLAQVTETGTSQAMERHAFEKSLEFVRDNGIDVECIVTDRHRGIGASLKQRNNRHINHQYDVFHMAKSIQKKLSKSAKRKANRALGPWIKFIKNHLWYSSSTCEGDDVLLQEKWLSLIDHIANRHTFRKNQLFKKCAHHRLTPDEKENITWLRPGSAPHRAMREIVSNKTFVKDMAHLTGFKHTGVLEVYHNMLTKYTPKRLHFPYLSMRGRLQLSVLDHNNNVFREQAKTLEGDPRWSVVYPKRTSLWVARKLFEAKTYEYRQQLMEEVVRRKESGQWKYGQHVLPDPEMPANIAPVERGSKQEAVDAYRTRFRPR
ncbi:uncharacterized protein LOC144877851 [Branchiostoma floridae x Branchiostoma japonicum]